MEPGEPLVRSSHDTGPEDQRMTAVALDMLKAIEPMRAISRQSTALLRLQAGLCALDVGCGTGDDVRDMAKTVGPSGRAVGIDISPTLIAEARQRMAGSGLPCEFLVGDAQHLPFEDACFDGCRSERVLQHMLNPELVLKEMVRVTRSGCWIVVTDTDWGAQIVDSGDLALTRALLDLRCDGIRHGWIGRQLPGMFMRAGLRDISTIPTLVPLTDPTAFSGSMRATCQRARESGMVSAEAIATWLEDLNQRGRAGAFYSANVLFTVAGRRS